MNFAMQNYELSRSLKNSTHLKEGGKRHLDFVLEFDLEGKWKEREDIGRFKHV